MTSRRLRERRISRAFSAREEKPDASDSLKKFADKAYDLHIMQKSVDRAARVSGGLWLSYLFALFYIGIAAGGVTHKDLLLENPARLPFLNVELPFVAFFALAPVLFVVSHAYTLMHFVLLSGKAGAFNAELKRQIREPNDISADVAGDEPALDHREIRGGLRRQLPSNIFVQFLAGPIDIREGGLGLLLKAIAWITLVIGPVLLLLLIQVQFLPYHLEWVTWVQRLAVLVDIVLLWLLWPAVLDGRSEIRWPRLWRHPFALAASLVPVALAFAVARYPGEWVDHHVGTKHWIPPFSSRAWHEAQDWQGFATTWLRQPGWTSVHDLVFNGEVDDVTRRRKSLFSNTLVLPEFDGLAAAGIDDPKKLEADGIKHSLVLRGRHLKGAVLTHADLRKADLEAAELEGANLVGAQLEGASLVGAQLQGANLDYAQLQGARLQNAQLQSVTAWEAQFQGATLHEAQLQGASLLAAQFQGASLRRAHLQAALLERAQLQGASLMDAYLQGASLKRAQLQGASLEKAGLQGTIFQDAVFAGTSLIDALVWRTDFEGASLVDVCNQGLQERTISKSEFATLETLVMRAMPEDARENALHQIARLNPDKPATTRKGAQLLENGCVDKALYQKVLARQLESVACSGDHHALYVVRGSAPRIAETGQFAPAVVKNILSDNCPVSAVLTEQDKARLKELAKEARAPESQQ